MSFITKRPDVPAGNSESAFEKGLTAQERAQVLMLNTLRELPKSRYATQLAITQIPAGRGRKAIFSHIEVYKMVEAIANELRETGVRPGTVCAMIAPNSIEAVVYFLAVQWIGAIAAPIDENLNEADMKSVLQAVNAFTVVSPHIDEDEIANNETNAKITRVAKDLSLIHWNIFRSTNRGVELKQHGRRAGKDAAWKGGAADFKIDAAEVSVHLGSPGSFNDSSPRGGRALVVPLSHANMASAAKSFSNTYGLKPDNNATVMTTQMHSIHGLVSLIGTLYSGGHIVIPGTGQKLSGDAFFTLAKENKVSWVTADSDFIEELHTVSSKDKSVLNGVSLAFVRCHDGRVSASSQKAFEANTKTILLESYGTAETSGIATSNTATVSKAGTAGKAVKATEIAVFDPETHKKLPAGKSGDVGVCSTMTMNGYLNNSEATDAFRVEAENKEGELATFILTGNRGTLDTEGFLTVDGDSREFRLAEEEIRSQRAVTLASINAEEAKKRQEQAKIEREARAEKERLEAEERKRREVADEARAKAEAEAEAKAKAKAKEEEMTSDKHKWAAGGTLGTRAWNNREGDGENDSEAMAKILERLMSIEKNQKKMEEDLKAKHALEMAEMQRLLEETQQANRLHAEAGANFVPPVMNMNMDEVNAAVIAASMAAQDSSRHTAEAAEAAKRAAAAAEEASKNRGMTVAPLDPNASKVEVFDPNNVQKTVVVSLDEVEEAMLVHPAVGTCRAFGRPDPRYGSEIYCCVLPKKGARVSEPWLKLHAQSVLPAACVPKKFFYREDLKNNTERGELSKDMNLKRISHLSGYSTTKMVKSPAWSPGDTKRAAA
jgi:acyl-CoA synthetase (AMP-forming)/AMP-acid ligase II